MARTDVSVRYQNRDVATIYDRHRYESPIGRYKNWWLKRQLARLVAAVPPGGLVLDLPCGTGRIDNWLLEAPVRVIASDISAEMLDVARQKVRPTAGWLGFMRAEAGRLPFRSGSIEGVFSIRFFHLLDQPVRLAALSEMARVAKGWVVIEYGRMETPIKAAKRVIMRWTTGRVEQGRMSQAQLAEEFHKCGLVIDHTIYLNRWLSGSILVRGRHQGSQSP